LTGNNTAIGTEAKRSGIQSQLETYQKTSNEINGYDFS